MRIRVDRAAVTAGAAALLLALTACSREAGPTPQGSPDPGPGALDTKLTALMADDCYRAPTEVSAPDCEKYVTQLANVPGTARGFADRADAGLAEAANDLEAAVRAYRSNACAAGGDPDVCAGTLIDMAAALEDLRAGLSSLPDVTTRPG